MPAGAAFLESSPKDAPVDKAAFDKACGVGESGTRVLQQIPSPHKLITISTFSRAAGVSFTPESLASTLASYFESLTVSGTKPADWSGMKSFRETLKVGLPDLRYVQS
jgi:hypothetical protein